MTTPEGLTPPIDTAGLFGEVKARRDWLRWYMEHYPNVLTTQQEDLEILGRVVDALETLQAERARLLHDDYARDRDAHLQMLATLQAELTTLRARAEEAQKALKAEARILSDHIDYRVRFFAIKVEETVAALQPRGEQ